MKVKNAPSKIWLQIPDDCDTDDFSELHEVSWCEDKINENDIEYIDLTKLSEQFDLRKLSNVVLQARTTWIEKNRYIMEGESQSEAVADAIIQAIKEGSVFK